MAFLGSGSDYSDHGFHLDRASLFRHQPFAVAHDGYAQKLSEFAWLLGGGPCPSLQAGQIVPQAGTRVIKCEHGVISLLLELTVSRNAAPTARCRRVHGSWKMELDLGRIMGVLVS